MAGPFCYAITLGLCYLCFFFLFIDPIKAGASHGGERFFMEIRPGDNIIPEILANRIYGREPLRPFCCGDWLSSDRPPLQAGIFLLERPPRVWGRGELNHELIGTALQVLWVCGVWCLLVSLGASSRSLHQAMALILFSGFLFYNTVYVWPKMLAAALILFVWSIAIKVIRERRPATRLECGLAAVCLGSAVMTHPGCTFSLPALALLAVRYRRLFPFRYAALALGIVLGFQLPWTAYQKFVDPPGNRLLKIHLAGQISVDQRSTFQAIKAAYGAQPFARILQFKRGNLMLLAGRSPLDLLGLRGLRFKDGLHLSRTATEQERISQREYIWNALGALNLGWIVMVLSIVWRGPHPTGVPFARWIILAALVNLVAWSLVTFGPEETVTTHSSYSDIFLLSVGLAGLLLEAPRLVVWCVFGFQIFNLGVVWIWSAPLKVQVVPNVSAAPVLQIPLLVMGMSLATGLAWHLGRSFFEPETGSAAGAPAIGNSTPRVTA